MIIDLNNNVWAFGYNKYGQLGLGHKQDKNVPTLLSWNRESKAKNISCGWYHTMLIDLNDNVWAFGDNTSGQLGLGDYENRFIPTQIPNIKVKSISCGIYHNIIIDLNDNIWSFGYNSSGQLGLGDKQIRLNPTHVLSSTGQNIKARSISCGGYHSLMIDMNYNVWSFGYNNSGQLGLGSYNDRNRPTQIAFSGLIKNISCGGYHSMIIDLDDQVWTFGDNSSGQLGLGNKSNKNRPTQISGIQAKFISCGDLYTMIIDMSYNVWAFGSNKYGQLGLGDYQDKQKPTQIPEIKGLTISCGQDHTIVILSIVQFGTNVYLLPFNEIMLKFMSGQILNFNILPEYQVIPHKSNNHIAAFYGKDGNIYLTELQYDQESNQIYPPL